MSEDPLDQPASLHDLRVLHHGGLLDDEAFRRASTMLRPSSAWVTWVRANLQLTGAALILAGVVFFFAYNWKEMGRFEKLGLIEAGVIASVIAAFWKGADVISGKLFLLSSSVLVGVFLAVFGQIYQTGADAYELFIGWAALILVWTVLARFAGLWFFWLVLVETGALLFWMQVGEKKWDLQFTDLALCLAAINALALVIRELAQKAGCSWISGRWHRAILFLAVTGWLSVPVLWLLFEDDTTIFLLGHVNAGAIHIILWLGACLGGYAIYRKWIPDFTCLSLAAANVALVFLTFVGKLLFVDNSNGEPFVMFLLFAVIICLTTAGLSFFLAKENKAMKTRLTGEVPAL